MTRENYMRIDDRIAQIKPLIQACGTTRAAIAKAIGVTTKSAMSRIMDIAVARGACFVTFARVSEKMKTAEQVYFPTAEDRDRFRAAYDLNRAQRDKERQARRSRESYERHRGKIVAQRRAQREAERAAKEAQQAAAAAQARAMRAAEAEQRKERARLDREAREAAKAREKAEAKKQRLRLKVETAQAGQLIFKKGTEVARPKKFAFADLPVHNPNGVTPKVIPSNLVDRLRRRQGPERHLVQRLPRVGKGGGMSEMQTFNRAERRALAKAAKKPPRLVKRPDPLAYRTAIAGAHKLTVDDQLSRAARVRCSIEELGKDAANINAWRDVFDVVNMLEAFARIGCIRHASEFLQEQQDNVVAALDRQRETGSNVLRPLELQLLRDLAATWAEVLAEVTCNQYLQAEERVKRKVSQALKAGARGSVRLITPPESLKAQAVAA